MQMLTVRPGRGIVLVEPIKEPIEDIRGGIIIPASAREKRNIEGKVIAVGEERVSKDGRLIKFEVKAGDRVLLNKYPGTEISILGESLFFVKEDEILGVIE